jgi:hypothetical protein
MYPKNYSSFLSIFEDAVIPGEERIIYKIK